MINYYNKIINNNHKYYYYALCGSKIYFLSSSDKLNKAKIKTIQKIKSNIKKFIGKKLIFIKIIDTLKEFEDKNIPIGLVNGPVAFEIMIGLIENEKKIRNDEKIENNKYYLSKNYIEKNIENISKEFKNIIIKYLNSLEKKKYISLSSSYAGNACAIKQSITNYYSSEETDFFDWLVCSMKSVNEVLNGKSLLLENNYIYPNPLGTTSINFLGFDKLISHHDIHEYNDKIREETIEKYNRRYIRLINTIKNHQNIYFLRYCKNLDDLEEEEIIDFYNNLYNINKKILFKFVMVSDCENLKLPKSLLDKENFIYINLNNYLDDEIMNETNEYLKKIKLYKIIYKLIK